MSTSFLSSDASFSSFFSSSSYSSSTYIWVTLLKVLWIKMTCQSLSYLFYISSSSCSFRLCAVLILILVLLLLGMSFLGLTISSLSCPAHCTISTHFRSQTMIMETLKTLMSIVFHQQTDQLTDKPTSRSSVSELKMLSACT